MSWPRAGAGPLAATHRAPAVALSSAAWPPHPWLTPAGGPGGHRFPGRPPSCARRAEGRSGVSRRCRRPLASPSSLTASLPLRPASYFLDPVSGRARQESCGLQGFRRAPSLARHKDGTAGGAALRDLARFSLQEPEGGVPTGTVINEPGRMLAHVGNGPDVEGLPRLRGTVGLRPP